MVHISFNLTVTVPVYNAECKSSWPLINEID